MPVGRDADVVVEQLAVARKRGLNDVPPVFHIYCLTSAGVRLSVESPGDTSRRCVPRIESTYRTRAAALTTAPVHIDTTVRSRTASPAYPIVTRLSPVASADVSTTKDEPDTGFSVDMRADRTIGAIFPQQRAQLCTMAQSERSSIERSGSTSLG